MRHLNVVGCPIQNQSAPKIVRSVAEDTGIGCSIISQNDEETAST